MQKVCHFFSNFPLDTHTGKNAASFKFYRTFQKVLKTLPQPIQVLWINNTFIITQTKNKLKGNYSTVTYIGDKGEDNSYVL